MKGPLLYFVVFALSIFLNSCQNSSTDNQETDIALLGTWHATAWDYDITFTNKSITLNSGYTGTILRFDNTTNTLIMKWTNHPVFTGKYQKWIWSGLPISEIHVYTESDTENDAINDTTEQTNDTITQI